MKTAQNANLKGQVRYGNLSGQEAGQETHACNAWGAELLLVVVTSAQEW